MCLLLIGCWLWLISQGPSPCSGAGGDPLCRIDRRIEESCCDASTENKSCWKRPRYLHGPREFHRDRCCRDALSASALNHGDSLPPGHVLELLQPDSPAVIIVRNVPSLASLLKSAAHSWYDVRAWPNTTAPSPHDRSTAFKRRREAHSADSSVAASLHGVVRWIVNALAKDLAGMSAPGSEELLGVLGNSPVAHLRHFEYEFADWTDKSGWIDSKRWGNFFAMHSDTFWISLQTCPTLGGEPFMDGTFIVDSRAKMHRVRLGEGDVAIWFGDVVQSATGGWVKAAKHMVLVHHSYRARLAAQSEPSGPRRVTMFHIYPHSRHLAKLREAVYTKSPRRASRMWSEFSENQRSLKNDIELSSSTY